jgi:hypothetical protein
MDNGAKRIEGTAAIRVLPMTFGWNPIAPSDEDVSLEVTDGQGRIRPCYPSRSGKKRRLTASEMAGTASRQVTTFASELEAMAKRNPLGTIAGAVVVGVLIGLLARGRSA